MKLDYGVTDNSYAGFDRFGRIVDQIWTDYGADPDASVDEYRYGYDRAGNRVWKENVGSAELGTPVYLDELYAYDALGRSSKTTRGQLNTAHDAILNTPTYLQEWGLDALANFGTFNDNGTSQTRTANAVNEIATISSGVAPTYDAAGNMISGPSPTNSAVRLFYVYDAWNRLAAVYEDDGDGNLEPDGGEDDDTLLGEYKYDGLNRRTKKTETGSRDEYYYNQNGQIVEDRYYDDGDLDYIEQYVWSQRDASSPIVCLHDGGDGDYGPPDGYVSAPYTGNGSTDDWRTYYMNDANHNVTTTIRVNNANTVVDGGISHNFYTSYGEVTRCLENWTSGGNESAFDGPLYAGYWFDVDTGLYQVRARYYDPGLSRFINRDPIGYNGGMNLYAYCGDNPINATDPSGLYGEDFHTGMTRLLANWAGMSSAAAEKISRAANKPDENMSDPVWAFENYALVMGSLSSTAAQKRDAQYWMDQAKEWHFPADADGVVRPGSDVARRKVKNAREEGDGQEGSLITFGKGLHVLQDSYSHQGIPVLKRLGHGRQAVEDRHYKWAGFFSFLAGEGLIHDVWSGKYNLLTGPDSALSKSADNPKHFPATARAAAFDTYTELVKFGRAWPGLTGSTHDAWSPEDVMKELEKMFPGDDPTP